MKGLIRKTISGALLLTMTAATVLTVNAAGVNIKTASKPLMPESTSMQTKTTTASGETNNFPSWGIIRGTQSFMMKRDENGVTLYSADGGETWTEEAPEGMPETGEFSEFTGVFPAFGTGVFDGESVFDARVSGDESAFAARTSMIVKMEDGIILYSTDGGETWTEEAPEGMEVFIDENGGHCTIFKGEFAEDFSGFPEVFHTFPNIDISPYADSTNLKDI